MNPLPATSGAGNPISLPAGQKLPEPSSYTANTVNSNVRLDKASYERSDSGPPVLPNVLSEQERNEANGASMFTLPPVGGNMIPESSLPMGDANRALPKDNGPFISSIGPNSTTAQLAGQAPIEPRGVPSVVADSQQEAHVDPEASSSQKAVEQKGRMEDELKHTVHQSSTTSESGLLGKSERGMSGQIAGAAAAAGTAIGGAAVVAHQKATNALGSDPVKALPTSIQNSIERINGNSAQAHSGASGVPSVVTESQQAAHVGPEATANAEAVREKTAVENELHRKVNPALASTSLGSDPASAVPSIVADSQHRAHVDPEATANAEAVREKNAVENELHRKVSPALASSSLRSDPASSVPSIVAESQHKAHADPEAAANSEAVREKTAMENELHSKVTPALASTSISSSAAPVASVPSMVTKSQSMAHVGPEAASNKEAVAEKSAVENELKSHVSPVQQSGEPAPVTSAALASSAPGDTVPANTAPAPTTSLPATPQKNSPAPAADITDSPASAASKASKRKSFLSKIKSKLSSHK